MLDALQRIAPGQAIIGRDDQLLFSEGDPADAIYFITKGFVRCHVSSAREGPEERTTLLCRAPALLGDRDTLAGTSASESVRCLGATELSFWDAETFLEAWSDPVFANRVARDLAERYARTTALAGLQLSPLAHSVAALQREVEQALATPAWLARALSVTTKSVTRAISQLRDEPVELPELRLIHSLSD